MNFDQEESDALCGRIGDVFFQKLTRREGSARKSPGSTRQVLNGRRNVGSARFRSQQAGTPAATGQTVDERLLFTPTKGTGEEPMAWPS